MSFAMELELERIEAQLAAELPSHVRAFARAHAAGAPPPAAPEVARAPRTLAIALAALATDRPAHDAHDATPAGASRALAILRLVAPIAIADDPAVRAAYAATPSWPALAALARARDAATRARSGRRYVALVHRLHGSAAGDAADADAAVVIPPPVAGWFNPSPASGSIEDVWHDLADVLQVRGAPAFVRAAARPRAFIVEPGREVIVVVPATLASAADRFAALHELGHAAAALLVPRALPRAVDEAAAAFVARLVEQPSHPWYSPLAGAARTRRLALAHALDAVERRLPELDGALPAAAPPWALWHDAGAQAAYVTAEALANRWTARDLAAALVAAADAAR